MVHAKSLINADFLPIPMSFGLDQIAAKKKEADLHFAQLLTRSLRCNCVVSQYIDFRDGIQHKVAGEPCPAYVDHIESY
jgi:hypothetical protein